MIYTLPLLLLVLGLPILVLWLIYRSWRKRHPRSEPGPAPEPIPPVLPSEQRQLNVTIGREAAAPPSHSTLGDGEVVGEVDLVVALVLRSPRAWRHR